MSLLHIIGMMPKPLTGGGGSVAFDAATSGSSTSGSAWTVSHTTSGANRFLVVGLIAIDANTSGVTYGGVSMTLIGRATLTALVNMRVELWGLIAPATGANNVSVTPGVGYPHPQYAFASSYTGVHQTTPTGTAVTKTQDAQNGESISISVTSATNEIVVDACVTYARAATAGAGQTSIGNTGNTGDISGASSRKTGAASTSMSWSWSGNQIRAQVGAAIKPA